MSVGPLGEPGGLFLYDEGDGEPAAGSSPVVSCERCSRSAWEIHLPQTLNEEASADEFSDWEQVSFPASATLRSPHTDTGRPRMLWISRPHESHLPT